jgi:hypothetical protein
MRTPDIKFKRKWAVLWLWLLVLSGWIFYCSSCIAQLSNEFGYKVACTTEDPHGTKILFIGNSFTYVNDVPSIFAWMVKKQQPNYHFQIVSFSLPSYTLTQHSERPEIKNLLAKQSWNLVVLQDQSSAPFRGQLALNESFEALLPLIKIAKAKPLAVMTWADRGHVSDQSFISQTYRRTGQYLHMNVIPVGDLFFYVQEKYPDICLYSEDDHHPSIAGSYLYALAVYAHIFGRQNLAAIENNDKSAPPIKADVAKILSMCVHDWPSICRIHPEFTEE